jgi:hypothetical protein
MKWLLSLFAVFVFTASAADLSGTWKAAIETPNGSFDTTFKFKVDGNKLTGTVNNQFGGEQAISEGKVEGENVSFEIAGSFNGNDFKLNYKGKLVGEELKFTVEITGMDRTFEMTAKRVS